MGPNSRRNQLRNQASNQGPARARFSNWQLPNNKKSERNRNDRDNNNDKKRDNHPTGKDIPKIDKKNQKINISLIEERVLQIKKNDNRNSNEMTLPLHIENMIKQRQIDKIELSSIIAKQLTETLNMLVPNENENAENNENNDEIIDNNYDIKCETSSNKNSRISLPSKYQTLISTYEKEIIKKFACLGFFDDEVLQVLKSSNSKTDEDYIYLGLLMLVISKKTFDKYIMHLNSIENLDNQYEEILSRNHILNEEEDVLRSIYEDSICIRHVLLGSTMCSIVDLAVDTNSSIRIFITNIDVYPSSSEFFGWYVNNNETMIRHHRATSLEGHDYIKTVHHSDFTSPLCFEFIQFVQSQPRIQPVKVAQPEGPQSKSVHVFGNIVKEDKVQIEEEISIKIPVKPNPDVLKIAEYRNSLLEALNMGLTGENTRAYALEQYQYLLPQRIIDEIKIEEERQELERATAYDINMFGLKGEIECTKEILLMLTDLSKAKAKSLVQTSIKQLIEENNSTSYNKSTLSKKIIDRAMKIYGIRLDKQEQKQEKMRRRRRGLTIRQAFEIVAETKNNSDYPRVKKLCENDDNHVDDNVDDKDGDSDEDEDDYDDDDTEFKEIELRECLAKLRLKLKEREEEGVKEIDHTVLSTEMKRSLDKKRRTQSYNELLQQRSKLPTFSMKEDVVSVIKSHQITVVSGETGCGKTTQIPQLILDDAIDNNMGGTVNIVVTQPRRISAISVAERIAVERMEPVGSTVGYHIRMEKKVSSRTVLSLVTTGVLLRRLLVDYKISDVTHLIIDEIHERDLNTDFLLIIIKILLQTRSDLKIILMSATINAQSFLDYFKDENLGLLSIPGRQFPVNMYFLEDAIEQTCFKLQASTSNICFNPKDKTNPDIKLARLKRSKALMKLKDNYSEQTIKTLDNVDEAILNVELIKMLVIRLIHEESAGSNAFLIFASGIEAIRDIVDSLKNCQQLEDTIVLPLHSTLPSSEQSKVFSLYPNKIKIVVATNIAETSITIPDITVVIDTGRCKENRFDHELSLSVLEEKWCSKANRDQRKGRAGRVRDGTYYLLASSVTFDNDIPDFPTPEILRVSLEEVTLQICALQYGNPYDFLKCGLTVPSTTSIKNSIKFLEDLEAISIVDSIPQITPMGMILASLPVSPRIGILLLYGVLLKVIDPILSIAALMSTKIFITNFENRDNTTESRKSFLIGDSDILTNYNAFTAFLNIKKDQENNNRGYRKILEFCKKNCLNYNNLLLVEQLRKQYLEILIELGMITEKLTVESLLDSEYNTNASNIDMICMAITKGCCSSILKLPSNYQASNLPLKLSEISFNSKTIPLYIHPSCILSDSKHISSTFLLYFEAGKTSKIFARDITPIKAITLVLFGGKLRSYIREGTAIITIDDWLVFEASTKLAEQITSLKGIIEDMFISKILSKDDENKNKIILNLLESLSRG